jgi:hypothetical protein
MFKLTYQKTYHYLDADRYPDSRIEDVDFIYGDTYEDVLSNFSELIRSDIIQKCESEDKYHYYDYDILAIDKVQVELYPPHVSDLEPVKAIIAEFERKNKLDKEKEKAKKERQKKLAEKRKAKKEFEQYKKLKEKFDKQ